MTNQYPVPQQDYMVLIICCTFNHENYIKEALEGFVMQKTNFPYVALIIDDASTDKTASIIKEYENNYPNIIKGIYLKENHYGKKSKNPYIKPWRNRCKYEAICEGDDYWIDPYKLQKQIDFLNKNIDYGMCYTKAQVYNQNLNKYKEDTIGINFNLFEDLLLGNKIPTLTTVYRIDLYLQYVREVKPETQKWKMGDYPMWLWFAANCKIKFIDKITATYRVLENSASHYIDLDKKEQFLSSVKDIRLFFHSKYSRKGILITTINDMFHRECMINGEISNERIYSLNHLKSIINKRKKDYIKLFLYHTKIGFLLTKYINLLRL